MGDLIHKISQPDHILAAFYEIRENYFHPALELYKSYVPGIDGLDLKSFQKNLSENIQRCRELILQGKEFHPQLCRTIPKDQGGELREVYVQSLRDKVVQKALAMPLAERLEAHYFPNLYSYRKGKRYSNKEAARLVRAQLKKLKGRAFVYRTDIPEYTEHLKQERLLAQFETLLPGEPEVLELFQRFLRQRCYRQGKVISRLEGIPSGSPLTPICANLYLKDLDEEMFRRRWNYFRYGDDILVLAESEGELNERKARVEESLISLGLGISQEKTALLGPGEPFEYLGYRFEVGGVTVAAKTLKKYRNWVREQLPRQRYRRFPNRTRAERRALLRRIIIDLNTVTQKNLRQLPWIRSFPVLDTDRDLRELDHYIKDRIRLCVLRRPSPRARQMLPDKWFGELGYKSLVGAYHRITRRRSLGPFLGWRRYFGANFDKRRAEQGAPSFLSRRWADLKFHWRFFRRCLDAGTFGDSIRNGPRDNDEIPGFPSGRS